VTERDSHRVEQLLRNRRHEENAARQAFRQARGSVAAAQRLVDELGALLAEKNDAARRELTAATGGCAPAGYRASAADLLAAIGQQRAEAARHEETLARRRAELGAAIRRRKVAEALQRRIVARGAARASRAEAQQADDRHASQLAREQAYAT